MDALLLVFIIIISILLLLVNVYILAVYIHPDDKGFGNSIFPKIIIVLGLSLAWGQMFMVPLDVANSRFQLFFSRKIAHLFLEEMEAGLIWTCFGKLF